MSWVRIESAVARHRKFLRVGPAASWLWLCGLCYAQEGLTDGFIPVEALNSLGVTKGYRTLSTALVDAGLWEEVEGGWQIHDYLKHNRSSATVGEIKHERREAGRLGGVASGEARRRSKEQAGCLVGSEQVASPPTKQTSNPSTATATETEQKHVQTASARETPIDEQAQRLLNAYPPQGACSIHAVTAALGDVLRGKPAAEFDALLARLDGHKRSAKWTEQGGRFIPRLDRYLISGTHLQVMPSAEEAVSADANAKLPAWARKAVAARKATP